MVAQTIDLICNDDWEQACSVHQYPHVLASELNIDQGEETRTVASIDRWDQSLLGSWEWTSATIHGDEDRRRKTTIN
jgi:hypothetical protein